jgi:hypothetical protein
VSYNDNLKELITGENKKNRNIIKPEVCLKKMINKSNFNKHEGRRTKTQS